MNPKDLAAECRVPLQLLPAVTAIYGAMACRQGAIDYGPYNWRDKPISLMKYIGAIMRHSQRMQDGEWLDKKSGQPHLGHIIATAGIIADAYHCGTLIDDRSKVPGPATELLDQLEEMMKNAVASGQRGRAQARGDGGKRRKADAAGRKPKAKARQAG